MKKPRKNNKKTFLLTLALALIMIACEGGDGGTSVDPEPEPNPNPDPEPTISFDSGTLTPGASFSYTFNNTGSTDYVCIFHSSMQGSVTVEDGASTEDVTVTIANFSFNPSEITIGPSTEVTWVNEDDVNHTATSQ